jgi:GntR family transcriptional repressor for pyruvate dehydrogenase complex
VKQISPLRRTTLTESLLTQLRRQILSKRLEPGQQIPSEFALCEAFNVGRTTVREALRGLEAAGFVRRAGKRLIVLDPRQVDPDERDYGALAARVSVRDVYESRKLLEMQIAGLAAEHHRETDLEELVLRLEATETADQPGFHGADAEFHSAIAAMCNNVVLAEIYEKSRSLFFHLPTYWQLFGGARVADSRQSGIDGASGGHRRIYEAIASRDSAAAAKAVFDHLDVVEKRLITYIDSGAAQDEHRPEAPSPEAEITGSRER